MTWTPPEPYAYSCESKSQGIGYVETLHFKPIDAVREKLYTLTQIETVRREAIEECAKVCDLTEKQSTETFNKDIFMPEKLIGKGAAVQANKLAAVIRELLEQT